MRRAGQFRVTQTERRVALRPVTLERRGEKDRRTGSERRVAQGPVVQERRGEFDRRSGAERRSGVDRRERFQRHSSGLLRSESSVRIAPVSLPPGPTFLLTWSTII